ncbi:MAG: histone H1 [Phycisphaerae bacterium]|nr:histone H1 [Phycisphaerae bacterium]
MKEYEQLRQLVESCADDVAKAEGGNKAAGTRVRKTMQDIKNAAQEVRKRILEVRSTDTPAVRSDSSPS